MSGTVYYFPLSSEENDGQDNQDNSKPEQSNRVGLTSADRQTTAADRPETGGSPSALNACQPMTVKPIQGIRLDYALTVGTAPSPDIPNLALQELLS